MASWSKDQKVCCTCRYWMGRRDIDCTASFFNAMDFEGKCNGPDGSFRPMNMSEGASCMAWQAFR